MWVEAVLLKEDLEKLLGQFMPVEVQLGDDEGRLALHDPSDVSLLAGVGLRVVCKAKVHWPVLGIEVPVSMHSLAVVLRPEIETRATGPALVFKIEIEHADVAGVPTIIDNHITDRINEALTAKHVELTWSMAETLTTSFELPTSLEPLDAFALGVADARVKVTGDAVGLAILFRFAVTRHGVGVGVHANVPVPPAAGVAPADEVAAPRARTLRRTLAVPTNLAIAAGVTALLAGGLMGALGGRRRRRGFFD